MKLLSIWAALVLLAITATAQDRYVVFFADKEGSPFSLERPEDFLSQRALDRYEKNGVVLEERDLPVNQSYIDQVAELGVETYYASRWFNALLIEGSEAEAEVISAQDYVSEVLYVAQGEVLEPEVERYQPRAEPILRVADEPSAYATFRLSHLGLDVMHSEGYDGEGVLIAVTDAGFPGVDRMAYFEHLFANNQLLMAFNFVNNSEDVYHPDLSNHGTKALSCIAPLGEGLRGGAPAADYMLFVTEEQATEYIIEEFNWIFAAEKADSAGAGVINISLGYNTFDDAQMNYSREEQLDGKSSWISRAAGMASDRGIVVVASAGNAGRGGWTTVTLPADHPDVLAIGAVDSDFARTAFSSTGGFSPTTKPDLVALGQSVPVLAQNGNITFSNGTSFSSPLVAGLTAGLIQALPQLSAEEIRWRLKNSGTQSANPDTLLGYGVPNFLLAYEGVAFVEQPTFDELFLLYPVPASQRLMLRRKDFLPFEPATLRIVDVRGQEHRVSLVQENDPSLVELDVSALRAGVYVLRVDEKHSLSFSVAE